MTKVKTRGTELWIGTQAADPVTDTYTQVPGTVQIQGAVGTQWSEQDTTELTDTDVQIDKGSRNRGRLTFVGNFHEDVDTGADPGLAAFKAAADHDSVVPYNIMLKKSNGRRGVMKVSVHQFQHTFGGQQNVIGFTSLVIAKAALIDLGAAPLAAPVNLRLPAIAGLLVDGGILTAVEGLWTGEGALTRRWQVDDSGWVDIDGATGLTHEAVEGESYRIAETSTNGIGSTTAYSAPTTVTAAG